MEGPFKSLLVWQKAMELVRLVYQVAKSFPQDERFVLTDQLRRAVVSIPANIAEGNGRASGKEYAHFLAIARGSLYETLTHLQVAQDLGYIGELPEIDVLSEDVGRMLTTLMKKFGALRSAPTPTPTPTPPPTPTPAPTPTPTPTPAPTPTPTPNPYTSTKTQKE